VVSRSDAVRRLVAAFDRGDIEAGLELFDPEVVWHPPPEDLDATGVGLDGVRRHVALWRESFEDFRLETSELREEGDDVVQLLRYSGRGIASGVEVDDRVWQRFTFRGSKVIQVEEWYE
jgi:ketosteroid isomerase-like protein